MKYISLLLCLLAIPGNAQPNIEDEVEPPLSTQLQCPSGTTQIGGLNADIAGCGLEGCDQRYQDHYQTIQDCAAGCNVNTQCVSFTWAPLNGDKNHNGKTVCTLYNSNIPNQQWSPEQIMCTVPKTPAPTQALICPDGTEQIGGLNADIAGCGIEGCDKRYQDHYKTIQDCKAGCDANAQCVSFTWAPLNGDRNHNGKTVCTLYDSKVPNQQWSPQQIMCAPRRSPAEVTLHCDNVATLEISYDDGKTFTVLATEDDWRIPIHAVLDDANSDTILKLTCEDQGVVGGFIATLNYDGIQYSTTQPVTDGYWKLISSSDHDTDALVYSSKTSSPWNINTEGIADDAVWIWNKNVNNVMVFEFDFDGVISGGVSKTEAQIIDNVEYSVNLSLPWIIGIGFILAVSVSLNMFFSCYMCCKKGGRGGASFGHIPVKDSDELEGKSTNINA